MKDHITIILALLAPLLLSSAAAGSADEGVSTREWVPLERRTTPYRITQGKDKGTKVVETLSPIGDSEHRWLATLGERRETHLRFGAEGGLSITEQTLPEKDKRCIFDPPITFLPGRLIKGRPLEEEGTVRIYDTEGGGEEHSGAYTQKIELLKTNARVQTPAGEFPGYHVRATQTMDLSWADIRITMDIVFHPDHGRVYQHTVKHTQKIGLLEDEWIEELRLEKE